MSLICFAQVIFLSLKADLLESGELGTWWFAVVPIILISISHTILSSMQLPIINMYVTNPKIMSKVLSMMKILEGSIIGIVIYINGHLR